MSNPPSFVLPILAATFILGACAGSTAPRAPSLLPRAIERRSDAEPVLTPEAVVPDPALDARIAERVAAFDAAARAFQSAQPAIAAKIARSRGAAEGSDRWLDGQSAIGELQQAYAATDGAMADLEQLAIDRAAAGHPPYAALTVAIATAQAELDRQTAIEAALTTGV